jgi:prepilin-type N-terminal cleavage/methylation domain-containing protein
MRPAATAGGRRARTEHAFTLIEIIVALVLIGIASAAIFPGIVSMLKSSTRSAALSGAVGDGAVAERLVEHDVRGAAGARSMGDRSDIASPDASVEQALNAASPAVHDVLVATPTTLTVRTEARRSTTGPETVTWTLVTDDATCGERKDGRNWCIVRRVDGGGIVTSEIATRGRGAFPPTVPNNPCGASASPRLFCYRVAQNASYDWDGGWRPSGCTVSWRSLDASFGSNGGSGWIGNVVHDGFSSPVRIHALDQVVGVAVTLPTGGGFAATSERSFNTTELAIRSRGGEAYQQAIMCGTR